MDITGLNNQIKYVVSQKKNGPFCLRRCKLSKRYWSGKLSMQLIAIITFIYRKISIASFKNTETRQSTYIVGQIYQQLL